MGSRVGFWQLMTGSTNPASPFEDNEEMVRADIVRNLHNVLNARRGRIVAQEEFGLDDAEDLGVSEEKDLKKCIRRLITLFEPRISPDPRTLVIKKVDTPGETQFYDGFIRQSFVIEGKMILPRGETRQVHIRTTMLSDEAKAEDPNRAVPRRVLVESEERK